MNERQKAVRDSCVVSTRPRGEDRSFEASLRELGVQVLEFPCLELRSVADESALSAALAELEENDWVFFTSANAVRFVSEVVHRMPAQVAAIGEKTAAEVAKCFREARVSFVAKESHSEGFAREFCSKFGPALIGRKALLLRGEIASAELPRLLSEAQMNVACYAVYKSTCPEYSEVELASVRERCITFDALVFSSAEGLRNFVSLVGREVLDESGLFATCPVVVLGPKTKECAHEQGFTKVLVSKKASLESMLEVLRGIITGDRIY